jgi:shikimate dehydrogenase
VLRLGVLGWPVAHSRSPAMQNAALAVLGVAGRYQLLPVPPELFAETVAGLPRAGFAGANVTIPHKEAALALATAPTDRARVIGAANTLTFRDGAIEADNTDAPGLLRAIGEDVGGRTALVLGAGGSARAAAWALREAGAAVRVHNRTAARAQALAAGLGVGAVPSPAPADLLVNCTSVGLTGNFKELPVAADLLADCAIVVDLVPRPGGTALLAEAQARGARVVDGLEVLVHQGALSLEHWTGRAAPLDVMRRAAHGELPETEPPAPQAGRAGR